PALLIAGEREDENDDAAAVAAMIPNGQSLRLPGLGHAGACAASGLTVPTARAFLERWFVCDGRLAPAPVALARLRRAMDDLELLQAPAGADRDAREGRLGELDGHLRLLAEP